MHAIIFMLSATTQYRQPLFFANILTNICLIGLPDFYLACPQCFLASYVVNMQIW